MDNKNKQMLMIIFEYSKISIPKSTKIKRTLGFQESMKMVISKPILRILKGAEYTVIGLFTGSSQGKSEKRCCTWENTGIKGFVYSS